MDTYAHTHAHAHPQTLLWKISLCGLVRDWHTVLILETKLTVSYTFDMDSLFLFTPVDNYSRDSL